LRSRLFGSRSFGEETACTGEGAAENFGRRSEDVRKILLRNIISADRSRSTTEQSARLFGRLAGQVFECSIDEQHSPSAIEYEDSLFRALE
jgi:hypothetical protein